MNQLLGNTKIEEGEGGDIGQHNGNATARICKAADDDKRAERPSGGGVVSGTRFRHLLTGPKILEDFSDGQPAFGSKLLDVIAKSVARLQTIIWRSL